MQSHVSYLSPQPSLLAFREFIGGLGTATGAAFSSVTTPDPTRTNGRIETAASVLARTHLAPDSTDRALHHFTTAKIAKQN